MQPSRGKASKGGLPTEALKGGRSARLRAFGATAGNLRVDSERRSVDQTFESWNPLTSWLRRLEELRAAA